MSRNGAFILGFLYFCDRYLILTTDTSHFFFHLYEGYMFLGNVAFLYVGYAWSN